MRFLLTILIWVLFVGGLWAYTWHRDAGFPAGPHETGPVETLAGEFSLEITPTFSIEPDPFALQSESREAASLELSLNGRAIETAPETLSRGKTIQIHGLSGLQTGFNEIYVKASPPVTENMLAHGVRITVLDQGIALVDQTVWGGRGALVSGTVSFKLESATKEDHDH